MNPTEIIRTTVDVIGVLLEVIRAIEEAVNNDDPEKVREILESALREGQNDPHDLQQRVRREVGKWVSTKHRRRPMIVPVVIEA